jgi:alpha-ketoglutarate-dependent taurine dioxygenase
MTPIITPLDATLGARITDIDLANLDETTWNIVLDAFHEHGILVFPAQNLADDEQVAFAERFGDIELLRADAGAKAVQISNQKSSGDVMQHDEFRFKAMRGNEGWHTDSSYMPLSAKASMLTALVTPSAGGETGFADMRAAYDELDDERKTRIEGLSAHHSLYHSQAQIGHIVESGSAYGYHDKGAPLRPLIKTHPATGRKSLYIGRHAYGIPGLDEDDSTALLDDLVTFACQEPRIYAHDWQVGDLVIWDNRCVLHRAQPYDYNEVRVMRHTRVAGDPATELVSTDPDARAGGYEPSTSNR